MKTNLHRQQFLKWKKTVSRLLLKHGILFSAGGMLYVLTEISWRGFSHWSMFLLGGLCFLLIGLINEVFPWDMSLWLQGVIGSAVITAAELITGYFVNIRLGWHVWDYTDMPLNLWGQICLPFSLLWIIISILAVLADDWLRHWLFHEETPHYRIF